MAIFPHNDSRSAIPIRRHLAPASVPGALILLLLCALTACEESLPPKEKFFSILTAEISITSVHEQVYILDWAPFGGDGVLAVAATNVHDEVLDDSAFVKATLEVWLKERPDVRTTLQVGESNITTPGVLSGGVLTLRPNDPLQISIPWNHVADNGTPVWGYVRLRPKETASGVKYCESDTVTLLAKGSLRLFRRIAPLLISMREFRVIYRVYDYSCPEILEKP